MKKLLRLDVVLVLILSLFVLLFLAAVFGISASLENTNPSTTPFITAFTAFLLAFFYFLFWREGLCQNTVTLVLVALPFCILLLVRLSLLDYVTLDYLDFLAPWGRYIKANGGLQALSKPIGNYNIPYLFLLAIFSYLPVHDLYLIKLTSIFFDFILAYTLMKIVSQYTYNESKQIACFLLALILPTPILNGALWGQCDSIYTAFAIASLYFGLRERPLCAVASISFAFAFKLQAIFLIPVFLILIFAKKLRWKHLLLFPLVYIAAVLPAILAGRPFFDTVSIYFSELGTVGSGLNYNSPSVFSLFNNIQNKNNAANLGLLSAFTLCAVTLYLSFIKRRSLKNKTILCAALIFVIGIPLLLPHMHDRYFFMADVLILPFAILYLRYIPLIALISFASLLGYYAYLKMVYLLTMNYGFVALLAAFICLAVCFVYNLFIPPPATVDELITDYTDSQ